MTGNNRFKCTGFSYYKYYILGVVTFLETFSDKWNITVLGQREYKPHLTKWTKNTKYIKD